ncbi:MAG: hypothetical protein ABW106_14375 [Steroidobacteraceae bacterium]
MKPWIVWIGLLVPTLGMACEHERRRCEQILTELIAFRTDAIESAFGDLSVAMPAEIRIRFVKREDPQYEILQGGIAYDAEQHQLLIPRGIINAKTPRPLRWGSYYWPYYQKEEYQREFPVIEAIDNALWSAFLQEAAASRGLKWPHGNCRSVEVSVRLPCEMLISAIPQYVKTRRSLVFNENRLDRIWPEDFAAFNKRIWRYGQLEYADAQRYGGILIIRPLIAEFGVPRVLAYLARTPFLVEENNLRTSALNYQERARDALRVAAASRFN